MIILGVLFAASIGLAFSTLNIMAAGARQLALSRNGGAPGHCSTPPDLSCIDWTECIMVSDSGERKQTRDYTERKTRKCIRGVAEKVVGSRCKCMITFINTRFTDKKLTELATL